MKSLPVFFVATFTYFAFATDAPRPPIPAAPHGGYIVPAIQPANQQNKVEEFFFEVVPTEKAVKIYTYLLVPRQVPSFLPVAPKTELSKIILSTAGPKEKALSYNATPEAIEAKLQTPKPSNLKISVIYKDEKREAELPLGTK